MLYISSVYGVLSNGCCVKYVIRLFLSRILEKNQFKVSWKLGLESDLSFEEVLASLGFTFIT